MKVLVTGNNGFIGRALCARLERAGHEVVGFDRGDDPGSLEALCAQADFVFHLAGVMRPSDPADFQTINVGLTKRLLDALRSKGTAVPIVVPSSVWASLEGRYAGSGYGISKREVERLVFEYEAQTGATAYMYRLVNVFGPDCAPNKYSVVATFCHNIAHDLPIRIDDPATLLELLYVGDLLDCFEENLHGRCMRCSYEGTHVIEDAQGPYALAYPTYSIELGALASLIRSLHDADPASCQGVADDFREKLYTTYRSYL